MAIGSCIAALKFQASGIFGTALSSSSIRPFNHTTESDCLMRNCYSNMVMKPLVIEARANTRTENVKTRNIRLKKKFNGTASKPRLSVFCSDKQLYAMLVDDQNKKCLFYGSTLQKSMRKDQSCTTAEAAKLVGEELIKTCVELNINEISYYDRNGLARGERMQAFEIAIGEHGFLPH